MTAPHVCRICGVSVPVDEAHFEPRFCYYYCDTHQDVPPVALDEAAAQFAQTGQTRWDRRPVTVRAPYLYDSGFLELDPAVIRVSYLHDSGYLELDPTKMTWSDQIFSHRDREGTYRHFDVTKLWQMVNADTSRYARRTFAVTNDEAVYLARNHGVDGQHLARITRLQAEQPGLMVEFPDSTQIVLDGNHRYLKRFSLGRKTMDFYVLTEAQARPAMLAIPPAVADRLLR